jgi:ubiquinone/menaquinone biosynthesis C-methylase UbiE
MIRFNEMMTLIQPHNERPAKVWSSGGDRYNAISRGIADSIEHAVLRLNPRPGEKVLDLATGTGWTSRVVARRGAEVIGVDIAAGLLEAAERQAAAEQLRIRYLQGDAEDLPFEEESFDAIVSTYGVMFASSPEAAAKELARVVRPGGRIALTTWTSDGNLFKMFQVMKAYMPPPAAPAPPSPFEWGNTERIRQLLAEDFELKFERAVSYYREPSAEAAWDTFSTSYGPTKMLADTLETSKRDALRADFVAFHAGFPTALGICVPREYWLTMGIRK